MARADPEPRDSDFSRAYRARLLIVLMLVNALNLADRQGLAVIAPSLKADLGFSDTQLGIIQGLGFAIFYSLLGLPIAWASERYSRVRIVGVSLGLFGLFVGLCSQARSFASLLLCRVGVGVGDAGFGPPVASLIGDHYPAARRASAMTIVWLGAPIGAMGGSVIGGWMAQNGDWRHWFLGLAIPSVVVALMALLTLREPRRGMSDEVAIKGETPPIGTAIRFLLAKPSMRQVLIGAALAATAMNGLGQFFGRYFVSGLGVGPAQAGQLLGTMVVIGMASGLVLGGFGVERLARRDQRWFAWGPACALVLATPLFLLAVAQDHVGAAMPLLIAGHIALFVYWTPTLALSQNMVGADMRASSAFVVSLVLGLVGIGLGPTFIGILSDLFAKHAFDGGDFVALCPGGIALPEAGAQAAAACAEASRAGITSAIAVTSGLFAWAGLHFLLAARHLRADLERRYR